MLSEYTYIICNAATDTGRKVAELLLAYNCHIIIAGPKYADLSAMEKELNVKTEHNIQVALLEPGKEIDWQNLSDSLNQLENSFAGIIHIHEIIDENQAFFDTSYGHFSTLVDDQLWGTYLSAKHLAPLFEDKQAGMMIHLVERKNDSMHYFMITQALEALVQTIQKELKHDKIGVRYLEVKNDSIENLLNEHLLK